MLLPSLPFLACLAVPLLGAYMAQREASVARIFLTLASCLGLIGALLSVAEALFSPSVFQSWPLATTLTRPEGTVASARLLTAVLFFNAAVLALCGVLFWFQTLLRSTPYTAFTRWLAAPLACGAATTMPMGFALTYFMGFYDWASARPSDKAFIIATSTGFTLAGFALAAFILQFAASALRAPILQRKA